MIDNTLYYPEKLGRFKRNSCMTIYYSEPIAGGMFYNIEKHLGDTPIGYISLNLSVADGVGWFQVGSVFSSGIISGEVLDYTSGVLRVLVNKDSFETLTALNTFISTHSGIYYNFELLRFWNEDEGELKNAILEDVMINNKVRKNNYKRYSPYSFVYEKDFYYTIETKTITLKNLQQIDDIIRAGSYVLKSQDATTVRFGALSDNPNVIGISGTTEKIISQPYFGGVQNNEWYRATLENSEFNWELGRYKGKLTFRIDG